MVKLYDSSFGYWQKHAEIHLAIMNDKVEKLKTLLQSGANPNQLDKEYWSPLDWAIYERKLHLIELLLEYGADVNQITYFGKTALIKTMEGAPTMRMLKTRHYLSNLTPEQVQQDVLKELELTQKIVSLLVSHHADISIKDFHGYDAYHYCQDEENRMIFAKACESIRMKMK